MKPQNLNQNHVIIPKNKALCTQKPITEENKRLLVIIRHKQKPISAKSKIQSWTNIKESDRNRTLLKNKRSLHGIISTTPRTILKEESKRVFYFTWIFSNNKVEEFAGQGILLVGNKKLIEVEIDALLLLLIWELWKMRIIRRNIAIGNSLGVLLSELIFHIEARAWHVKLEVALVTTYETVVNGNAKREQGDTWGKKFHSD